jgi:hypothetical protein
MDWLAVSLKFLLFISSSEIEPLLKMAADKGVDEAKKALKDLYPHKYS